MPSYHPQVLKLQGKTLFKVKRMSGYLAIKGQMTLPRMNSPNIQGDIRVIQHNCARSSNCMYSLLDTTKDLADIILIQEPWINQRDRTTIKGPRVYLNNPKPRREAQSLSFH